MKKLIEWFFNLFMGEKAKSVKLKAFLDRKMAVDSYNVAKEKNKKFADKYSGRKRYVKC